MSETPKLTLSQATATSGALATQSAPARNRAEKPGQVTIASHTAIGVPLLALTTALLCRLGDDFGWHASLAFIRFRRSGAHADTLATMAWAARAGRPALVLKKRC